MDVSRFAFNKIPTPATDGVQTVFTVPEGSYVSGLLELFIDGLQQVKGVDWTETSPTTFTTMLAPDSDEKLRVNYIKQ